MAAFNKVGDIVIPGDVVGISEKFEAGTGTFVSSDGHLVASLAGVIDVENHGGESSKPSLHVVPVRDNLSKEMVIDIGDVVLARVLRLSVNFASVEILSIGETGKMLRLPPKAQIRREDIRLADVDSLVVHECFRPGDIVKAVVISLGDARQYFLSTADVEYGVIIAKSEKSGQRLVPISAREMEDPFSLTKELRKVAKPETT